MSEDKRKRRYVPVDVNVAFGTFGTRLQQKWGMEGLCSWMLMLAAAKREPVQGTFTFTSEAEAWTKLGAAATKFTFHEFITFCGRQKQTRRTLSGRVSYVEITGWTQWNDEWARQLDNQRKSRKRADSRPDIPPEKNRLGPDVARTETETEYEVEDEPTVAGNFNIPGGLGKLMEAMTDRDELTVKRLSTLCEKHRFSEADYIAAWEAATGPGVLSPSAIAISILKKRAAA